MRTILDRASTDEKAPVLEHGHEEHHSLLHEGTDGDKGVSQAATEATAPRPR